MNIKHLRSYFLTILLALASSAMADTNPSNSSGSTIDLDMLYSTPSIIGTTPKSATWSNSGKKVAFLWNDEGYAFRDVWVYSTTTSEKKRLTHHNPDTSSDRPSPGISEVAWLNEDKNQIAYVLDGQLFVQSGEKNPIQIESDRANIKRLSLSPDGKQLAFVASGSLWVRSSDPESESSTRKLVDRGNPKAAVANFEWSADSSQLAFQLIDNSLKPQRDIYYYADEGLQKHSLSRAFPGEETARYTVGVVSLESGNTRMFERPDDKHHIWNYGLSNDGDQLFVNSSDMLVKEHTVYVYDVENGKRETFYQEFDAKHLRPDWKVAWAPDDDGLIILTDRDGYLQIYHQQKPGGNPKAITSGTWEISNMYVDNKKKDIYFLANKSQLAERQLYRVPADGGEIERVSSSQPGTHQPVFSPDKQYAATLFSSDDTPLELYVINLEKKKTTRVTNSPLPEFYQHTWANISYVEFESHVDGQTLLGRLSLPADYDSSRRYPLIVGSIYSDSARNQYGGRTSHPTWGLDQYLVAHGYIILNVNVRGSWGQGRKHNQAQQYAYGVQDIEDIHDGVNYLVDEGYVDPERVGIWGSSYGGLMTMHSLFKKPGVYAAGIAGAPATNVYHAYPAQMWVMGETTGDDQPGRYEAQSAKFHTAGLEDPLMIIHGSKDDVVLYSDTIDVVQELIAQEKLFELVTLPGVGHGWDAEGAAARRFSFKKMVEFFDRYLSPSEVSEAK